MNALTCLRKGELFASLAAGAIEKLAAASKVRLYNPGDLLVRAGDRHTAVGYLATGEVSFYRRNKARGVTLLLGVVEAPAPFGDADLAAGTPWNVSIRAETECWCVWIPNEIFLRTVRTDAELATRLYLDASVRHFLVNHTAQTMALYDVETRLLRLLLDLGDRFGDKRGDTLFIDKSITQVGMAAALGVTRQTIKRTLEPLEERGVVERHEGGRVSLHGLRDLEEKLPHDLFGLTHHAGTKVMAVTKRWTDTELP